MDMTMAEVLFFSGARDCLPLYDALRRRILTICPGTQVIVSKTQIAFTVKHRFAFASLRGKRLIVTFGLPERVDSPRIWQAVEPYPGRWTHHVRVNGPEEIDEELIGWIEEAWSFAMRK